MDWEHHVPLNSCVGSPRPQCLYCMWCFWKVLRRRSDSPRDAVVKNPPPDAGNWAQSLDQEGPLEDEDMAAHSSILAWRIPWTKEPGGLQSMGLQRVGHSWATEHVGISEVMRVQGPWWIHVPVRTGRETRRFPLSLWRWWRGAVYLLEDNSSQLPTLWKIHFCWLSLPVYDILLWQLKQYKTEEERDISWWHVCTKNKQILPKQEGKLSFGTVNYLMTFLFLNSSLVSFPFQEKFQSCLRI